MNWLKALDQFGIPYTPRINKQHITYRSILGGITSLLIYCTALSYCIYKIYIWQTLQIPPTTTTEQLTEIFLESSFDDKYFQFSIQSASGINPFDSNNMILIPIVQVYSGVNIVSVKAITEFEDFGDVGFGGFLPEIRLIKNASLSGESTQAAFVITPCSAELLYGLNMTNIRCANESYQKQYLEGYNIYHMVIQMKQFNPSARQFTNSSNSFYFLVDPSTPIYTQIQLELTHTYQDTGLIFQSISEKSFISDFSLITQAISPTFTKKVYQLDVVMSTLLRLNAISKRLKISYPKIGNILADIGSIISSLLSLKLIIFSSMNILCLMNYISAYQVSIILKSRRQVKGISINGKQVSNTQGMHQYLQRITNDAKLKLTALNSLYEISRLQFIVNSIQTKECLLLAHQTGIRLRYQQFMEDSEEQGSARISSSYSKQDEKLCEDDFNLLGMDYKDRIVSEIPFQGPSFYLTNYIPE